MLLFKNLFSPFISTQLSSLNKSIEGMVSDLWKRPRNMCIFNLTDSVTKDKPLSL